MLEACQRATGLKPNETRALLGQFLFSGEAAEKPLDGLSGGERRRLSLAVLVHSGANVLILDEPTNHLDLESREALEAALQAFPGALLLISHDRALLDAVGSRTVAVEDRTLHSYVGGWPEYVRVREERAELERQAKRAKPRSRSAAAAVPAPAAAPSGGGGASKNQQRQAARIEREIERAEAELAGVEAELADPQAWNDPRSRGEVDPAPPRGEGARRGAVRRARVRRRLRRRPAGYGRAPRGRRPALSIDALEHVGDPLAGVHGGLERLEDRLPADHGHRVDAVDEQRGDRGAHAPVAVVLEPWIATRCAPRSAPSPGRAAPPRPRRRSHQDLRHRWAGSIGASTA